MAPALPEVASTYSPGTPPGSTESKAWSFSAGTSSAARAPRKRSGRSASSISAGFPPEEKLEILEGRVAFLENLVHEMRPRVFSAYRSRPLFSARQLLLDLRSRLRSR